MSFCLAGRTALIAGASSGLGAHLAALYAGAGARVVLGARRTERTEQLAQALRDQGSAAISVPLDVTDECSVGTAFDLAERAFGTVDVILANAGITAAGRATEVAGSAVRVVADTNLLGVYFTAREGARRMIAADSRSTGRGRIVVIGSITADLTGQGDAVYAATKAGVAHLARQLAAEWARQGINVNTIQPGYIRTELTDDWIDTDYGKTLITSWPRRQLLPIGALDDMVLYLSSDASRHVTGTTVTIDDGQAL